MAGVSNRTLIDGVQQSTLHGSSFIAGMNEGLCVNSERRTAVQAAVRDRAESVLADVEQRWGGLNRIEPIEVTPLNPRDGSFPESADEYVEDFYPYASGAAVIDDGRLLCVYSPHRDEWETPGGAGEPGETPAETARRETREETGVECEITGTLCSRLMEVDLGYPETLPIPTVTFTARPIGGSELRGSEIEDHEEITDLAWFGPEELPEIREYEPKYEHLRGVADAV